MEEFFVPKVHLAISNKSVEAHATFVVTFWNKGHSTVPTVLRLVYETGVNKSRTHLRQTKDNRLISNAQHVNTHEQERRKNKQFKIWIDSHLEQAAATVDFRS